MRVRGEALLVALLGAGVATTFADWAHSGRVGRSSYELVRSAERLGLLDGRIAGAGAVVWVLLPLVAASAVVAVSLGRSTIAAIAAMVVGVALTVGWWTVKSSPLRVDRGAEAGAVCGLAIIAVAGWVLVRTRGARRDRQPVGPPGSS